MRTQPIPHFHSLQIYICHATALPRLPFLGLGILYTCVAGGGRREFHLSFCALSQQNPSSTWCKAQGAADPKEILLLGSPSEPQSHRGWDTAQRILWHGQAGPCHPSEAGTGSQCLCAQTSRAWEKIRYSKQSVNTKVYVLILLRNYYMY